MRRDANAFTRGVVFFNSPYLCHQYEQVTGVEFLPASFGSEKSVDAETQVGGESSKHGKLPVTLAVACWKHVASVRY